MEMTTPTRILLWGYSDLITAEKAADLGIRKFVMKPLRIHEIAQIVRETLDGPATPRNLLSRRTSSE